MVFQSYSSSCFLWFKTKQNKKYNQKKQLEAGGVGKSRFNAKQKGFFFPPHWHFEATSGTGGGGALGWACPEGSCFLMHLGLFH